MKRRREIEALRCALCGEGRKRGELRPYPAFLERVRARFTQFALRRKKSNHLHIACSYRLARRLNDGPFSRDTTPLAPMEG